MVRYFVALIPAITGGCASTESEVVGRDASSTFLDGADTTSFFEVGYSHGEEYFYSSASGSGITRATAVRDSPEIDSDGLPIWVVDWLETPAAPQTGQLGMALVAPRALHLAWTVRVSVRDDAASILSVTSPSEDPVDFEPPLVLATSATTAGETVETSTDGALWQSTVEGFGPCPLIRAAPDLWPDLDCLEVNVDRGAGGSPASSGLAGVFWYDVHANLVQFQLEGDQDPWQAFAGVVLLDDE